MTDKFLEMIQQPFIWNVLAGTCLIAAMCAYLGVFIVLRRSVLVGAALAQVSSLGVALSFFFCGLLSDWLQRDIHAHPAPFALALTVGVAVLFALQYRERRLPRETIIAAAYVAAGGIAVLVVDLTHHGETEKLNLLFGNLLTILGGDVWQLVGLAAALALVHWLFYKEFLFVSFDPEMAMATGLKARRWNILLFLTLGVTISLAIRAAGALVVFNFLVAPAAIGLLWGKTMRAVFCLAISAALAASVIGLSLSYVCDMPSGQAIVAVNAALLGLAWAGRQLWR